MLMTLIPRIRAISASLRWFAVVEAVLLLAGSRHNWQLPASHQHLRIIPPPPLVYGGSAFFLVNGATSPSVGGSVAVVYQVIGRTLRKR